MFFRFFCIIEEIFNRLFKLKRQVDVPTMVTIFNYVNDRAPYETVMPHTIQLYSYESDKMINEFYEEAESVDYWTNIIGCATSGAQEQWVEWDYTPEGELFPISYDPIDMPFSDAFQLAVDLRHTLEKGAPDYVNDLYDLNAAYMYAVLSAASDEIRNGFYTYILEEDDEFSYINHADLFQCHLVAMDMQNVII